MSSLLPSCNKNIPSVLDSQGFYYEAGFAFLIKLTNCLPSANNSSSKIEIKADLDRRQKSATKLPETAKRYKNAHVFFMESR